MACPDPSLQPVPPLALTTLYDKMANSDGFSQSCTMFKEQLVSDPAGSNATTGILHYFPFVFQSPQPLIF